MRLTLLFFIAEILFNHHRLIGQNDSLWIVPNLTELTYSSGKWNLRTEIWNSEVVDSNEVYYIRNGWDYKLTGKVKFVKLDKGLDSIYFWKDRILQVFIRSSLMASFQFRFYAFEYAILDSYDYPLKSYYLNRFGLFRVSNEKNETLTERFIDPDSLQSFIHMSQMIDVYNMDKAHDERNNCNDNEFSFTFWSNNVNSYRYVSRFPRNQLLPIRDYLLHLQE